ncbi:flagellin [Lichenihabitans sp. Uapishka_5]|uniref:flagellin N-terminal helical domain-containing protein n=1 Tax=Lichenihabitans sp. Uapishka_5 TaxID=3037302 RepID=UPI0029E81858|nr:flagellin [Lichenihabitans sp. Uapishka_5]MDX7952980.1 flagellin [Lichenihabitans sp. Uapishka_5]
MSSLLTNTSAMSALSSLTATQKSLSQTQSQISSGLRVASASDNAAYWSISTTMKSDTSALSAVSDALNLGSSTVGVATAALNSTLTIMNKMKADLVTAQTPGTDKAQVQTDITALQSSLKSIVSSASFNGVNLLNSTATNTNIVASFSRGTDGTTSVGTIAVSTANITLTSATSGVGILSAAITAGTVGGASVSLGSTVSGTGGSGTDGTSYDANSILGFKLTSASGTSDLSVMQAALDNAIGQITAAGAALGGTKTNIDNQSTFVSSLSDAITSGVGSLVDADMNVASTRLNALQTQQQLGVQALSIANQNSQMILKLFNG